MKGAPKCMRISEFMHGVNNPELTKRLNKHVPKTMKEMMIATIAFIRGEAAATGKKKGHASWKAQDQLKRHASERMSNFRGQPREGRGPSSSGTEGPLVIEAKIGGHMIHRMYVDGGSSTEVLYEHCFNRLRPEIKNQMVPATTSLTGFSRETIWPLGQLRLLVTIGDADHFTKAWMNFMIVRSLSLYNVIIGRPKIREIQAVPSTAHGMLKFPVDGGIVTIRSTILIPAECAMVITSSKEIPLEAGVCHKNFKVALHLNFPDQEEGYSPVRQKKRGQAPKSTKAIQAEVQKLVEAGIMREVYYHEWLSNPVMVKKHDDSWRMCVDFTDLNKACSQDCYPLPKIEWKVESLCGYPFKCFLDAYKGYHQIQMAKLDEEKTAFHTSQRVYCYTKMPFGLKNVGATFQRLVDKAFDSQVGQNIEMYVDDLVIKSHTEAEMLRDVKETFRTPEGIKPCPDKSEAVLQLPSPRTIKKVQSLNGKLASLNRFLSKSAEKSLPLFKTLKKCIKKSDFHWTPEAEQAFKKLKQHLSKLPLLVAPKPKEELIVYLSATHRAISAVLMTERSIIQTPIYFVSHALQGPKLNYTPMEKFVLSLVFAAKRLQRTITKIKHRAGRTQYHLPAKDVGERTDPCGFPYESGTGLILTSPEGTEFTYALRFQFTTSNNKAEYEALIVGLRIAAQMGVRNVHMRVDFKSWSNTERKVYIGEGGDDRIEEDEPTWMTPIIEYLKEGTLPDNKKEASKLRIKARQYELLEGILYKRSFLKPWLRCVGPLQVNYVIREIHEGSCSMHAGPRSVVAKAMRLGNPQQPLTPITALWPFYKWRIDIAGPFPEGPGKVKFLIVAMDYFTKWIEAKAVATITAFRLSETSAVQWAHGKRKPELSHGDTPFSLTYGTKAVIPAEIEMPTYRTAVVDDVYNNEELRLNLDLLEERRECAAIREAKAKLKMTKYYNARVRGVTFRPSDFVYPSNGTSHAVDGGKLCQK
ncbi:reverse transcriptase domain-containing protein [Tanacetum coccineum]